MSELSPGFDGSGRGIMDHPYGRNLEASSPFSSVHGPLRPPNDFDIYERFPMGPALRGTNAAPTEHTGPSVEREAHHHDAEGHMATAVLGGSGVEVGFVPDNGSVGVGVESALSDEASTQEARQVESTIDEHGVATVRVGDRELRMKNNLLRHQRVTDAKGVERDVIARYDQDGNRLDEISVEEYVRRRDQKDARDRIEQVAQDGASTMQEGTAETETATVEVKEALKGASDGIFDKTIDRLLKDARKRTTRNELVWDPATNENRTVTVTVDPDREFTDKYLEKSKKTLDLVAGRKFVEIAKGAIGGLDAKLIDPGTLQRGRESVGRFAEETQKLISTGEVRHKTAQVFWSHLEKLKGVHTDYNSLNIKEHGAAHEMVDQERYRTSVGNILSANRERVTEQEGASFYYVNAENVDKPGSEPVERLYVVSRADADPGAVVAAWTKTLEDEGLSDSVHYKVPTSAGNRFESIVVFRTADQSEEDFQRLKAAFQANCPPELLDDEPMPTAIQEGKGMYRAPEPNTLNNVLRYLTRDGSDFSTVSYNQLVSTLTDLSMRIAANDHKNGNPTPEQLKIDAKGYFRELLLLSGIDPDTMTDSKR